MNTLKITEIEQTVDKLLLDVLGPLRASKTINREAIQQLNIAIDELIPLLSNQANVPRILTGTLWYIFTSMLTEAEYAENRQEIENTAWGLQDKLRKIYGPIF